MWLLLNVSDRFLGSFGRNFWRKDSKKSSRSHWKLLSLTRFTSGIGIWDSDCMKVKTHRVERNFEKSTFMNAQLLRFGPMNLPGQELDLEDEEWWPQFGIFVNLLSIQSKSNQNMQLLAGDISSMCWKFLPSFLPSFFPSFFLSFLILSVCQSLIHSFFPSFIHSFCQSVSQSVSVQTWRYYCWSRGKFERIR